MYKKNSPVIGEINSENATGSVVQENERKLIAASQQRDTSAFKRLYELHLGRVYSLCLRLSGNSAEAEDIAQEVFIEVWDAIVRFKGESKFSTWLYQVTTNIAISHIRKRQRWWARFNVLGRDDEQIQNLDAGSEYLTELDRCIAELPEQARLVFVLFAVEGYRHDEIGRILDIAPGTSKAHYARARKMLKDKFDHDT